MSEFEIVELLQYAAEQITGIIGQIITINFAMIVAIFYFLHRSGLAFKLSAFILYSLGMLMYSLLAIRQSVVILGAQELLQADGSEIEVGPILSAMIEFGGTVPAVLLNITLNVAILALWIGVFCLTFFWKMSDATEDA